MTARMVMAMMSQRLCSRICWRRGAGTWAKHWRIETGFVLAMILLLREPCRTEKNHSCVHLSKSRPAPKIHRQESGAIALTPGLARYDLFAFGKSLQELLAILEDEFGERCHASYGF